MPTLALLLLSLLPNEPPDHALRDRCDVIEFNTANVRVRPDGFLDCGFEQVIFWERRNGRLCCRGYLMRENVRTWGDFVYWRAGERDCFVRAPVIISTVTEYDPEMDDRQNVPYLERRRMRTSR